MGKRIFLFLITNFLIVLTLTIVLGLLGLGRYGGAAGYQGLAVFALVWGMGGAFISLQMSRWIAKQATGIRLVDGHSGRAELDWQFDCLTCIVRPVQPGTRTPSAAV